MLSTYKYEERARLVFPGEIHQNMCAARQPLKREHHEQNKERLVVGVPVLGVHAQQPELSLKRLGSFCFCTPT